MQVSTLINIEERFQDGYIKQSWIDEFFESYPEFTSQRFILPALNWILPQAYAAGESNTFVFGQLVNTDPDGSSSFVYGATVCAYDDDDIWTPLSYNGVDSCSTSTQSGTFSFFVPTNDPNGSGNTDLILKAFAKNEHVIIYKNNNQNVHYIQSTSIPDISSLSIDFGQFDISAPQNNNIPLEHRAFWALEELNSIYEWYQDTINVNLDPLYVYYAYDQCNSVGVDPSSKSMTLSHTVYTIDNLTCNLHINSPITNSDTMAHEYAHFAFYKTYDERDSHYPPYRLLEENDDFHSPVHGGHDGTAWIEGWAFFMAIAYSGTPVYQPAYMAGQWNFETRTHNEESDLRFLGKSFHDGPAEEGNVAAALWDMIDIANEGNDDQSNLLDEIWITMDDPLDNENIIASNILDFQSDWNDNGYPNLDNIFELNTLADIPISTPDGNEIISDTFEDDLTDKWDLTSDDNHDWRIQEPDYRLPGSESTNTVGYADNCDETCTMTLKNNLDLFSYSDASLNFWWFVDRANDDDEGLRVELSSNGTRNEYSYPCATLCSNDTVLVLP